MRRTLAVALAFAAIPVSFALAQQAPELPQPSPKARVSQRVGLTDFTVDYSSPGVKGREIWGGLVPYDQLWRTGANAATTLEASRDFMFGGKSVPAGTYSVFTIPGKSSWTVVLNSDAKANTSSYDEKKDVVRITAKPETAPARERLTFLFSDTTDDSTKLDLEWEKLRLSVPIAVDSKAHANTNIDKALDDAWRPHWAAARYRLDNGGDLDKALGEVDISIAIKPTWWNNWVRAQILAKIGRTADAVSSAEKAQALGKDDPVFKQFFADQVSKSIADWKKKA